MFFTGIMYLLVINELKNDDFFQSYLTNETVRLLFVQFPL